MCSEVGFVKRVKCSRHIVYSVRSAGLIPIDSTTECSEVTTEVRSLQTGFSLRLLFYFETRAHHLDPSDLMLRGTTPKLDILK